MRRRQVLAALPALAMAPPALAQALEQPTLRQLASRIGVRIGSSSEIDLAHDLEYAALIAANCTLFAPNMSWQRMSPTPGEEFAGLDPNLAFARRAGLRLTGYHLLWHQRLPGWFESLDRTQAERAIVAHIDAIGARFGGETYAWNVVNEAIRPADGQAGGLRRSPLLDRFGTGFFDVAFDAARQARPGVIRLYNDYDLELDTPNDRDRRRALLGLLDELARRAVPIQAIGLQSHLRTKSFDRFDPTVFRRFLDELASRGLDIFITELDVHDLADGDAAARDRRVADIYRRFLDVALAQPRLRALVFWGLSDQYSWLDDPARPNYRRPDGLLGRSLPFGPDMQPTAVLSAVRQALADAPSR